MDDIIIVPWIDRITKILGRPAADVSISQTVLQVAVHSSHHRGQINKRIREAGGEPETVDFIAWVWAGKPSSSWENISLT